MTTVKSYSGSTLWSRARRVRREDWDLGDGLGILQVQWSSWRHEDPMFRGAVWQLVKQSGAHAGQTLYLWWQGKSLPVVTLTTMLTLSRSHPNWSIPLICHIMILFQPGKVKWWWSWSQISRFILQLVRQRFWLMCWWKERKGRQLRGGRCHLCIKKRKVLLLCLERNSTWWLASWTINQSWVTL